MESEWQKFQQRIGLPDPHETGRPWVSAHRGYSGAVPENTLAAVDAARAVGVDFIEFDVTRTSDGVPIIIHDDTLERTTDGTGTVEQQTLSELADIDAGSWLGPGFAGARIPTLESMLAGFAEHGGRMLFEFKGLWEPDGVKAVCERIRSAGLDDRVLVQSFNVRTVRNLLSVAPDLPRGLLRSAPRQSDLELLPELEVAAYNPSVQGLLHRPDEMRAIVDTGVGSFVWFVDEQDQWRRLLDFGVSSIITDHPARLQGYLDAVLGEAGHPAPPRSVPYRLPANLPN
ncbi:glycerophosphodiester phosphodiesterase [Spelaeicoccus albus]|uniref:Glycerophosphoryl diester phosphodiesterase n=1 Tax=Spelaeicoccus albus TaxID=1280376 RepID=A0A7Z0D5P9_9MICO|nr:glycerophosphodiester phosphodiesterase family protein [Spelaeicoccus albus]NYI69357.1 glycerophosphoryl diester phosphodiesterase [Spelaeicoccus albus]